MLFSRPTRAALVLTAAVSIAVPIGGGTLPARASAQPAVPAVVAGVPAVPAHGALFGAAVSNRPDLDVKASTLDLEGQIGRKLDVHRLYDVWDDPQPGPMTSWTVAGGRTPVLSIKASRRDGSVVRWADIAAGREDPQIRAQARGLKALNAPLFLSLQHEPENDPGNGTAADYVAAWRHYVAVFRSENVTNVSFTWILMAWSFERATIADSFYPGDDVIDWVAADGYNWYGTSADKPWRPLGDAISGFYDWGTAHHKPMMIAEYGSLEDPQTPGRKAAWITDAAAAIKTMPGIKAVLYFHSPVGYPWWIDSSASAVAAFADMGHDPYFRTLPEAALTVSPTQGPAPLRVVLDGSASYSAGASGLTWRLDFGDGSTALVTGTPPANVAHTYAPGSYTATLSVAGADGSSDVTNSSVTALPAPGALTNGQTNVTPTGATLNGRVDPNGLETSAWFDYGTTTGYGSATATTSVGASTRMAPFAAPVSGLSPNSTYHYRIVARSGAGTTTGTDGTFTTPGPPAATTGGANSVTATTAGVAGSVDANGLATDAWFEYGTTTAYGARTWAAPAGSKSWGVPVSATLSGLRANTGYHYRAVAANSSGTSYGTDRTLTTAGPAIATTGASTDVAAATAGVSGSVNANGLATDAWFEYGTTTAYGARTSAVAAGDKSWAVRVSATLGGLRANTGYHYRLVAANSAGTSFGTDRTLTTAGPAIATTGASTDVTAATAGVSGSVNANGLATDAWFEYGTTTAYGARTSAVAAGDKSWAVRVSATLGGLRANTGYHYRVVAANSSGTSYGPDRTLTSAGPATVTTGGARALTTAGATVSGNVDPNGLATDYRVEYGATISYGTAPAWRDAGSKSWGSGVSADITGLASRRLYHYRLVARNSAGTSYGLDRTFTTR